MFAPEEFIRLAGALARGSVAAGSRAARARTAHGRLYYGLFLRVRAILVQRHGVPVSQVRHGALYRHLQHSSIRGDLRELGRELERLYELRRKADYELVLSPHWQRQIEDPDFAAVAAARIDHLSSRVPRLDFTPIVHLF